MQNYLLHLKYEGTIELPDDSPARAGILKQNVINAIQNAPVALKHYEEWDNREIDNHDDGYRENDIYPHDLINQTATYIDINLPVPVDGPKEEIVDVHDSHSIYNYMVKVLKRSEVEVAYCYERDQGEFLKTVIGLNIVE